MYLLVQLADGRKSASCCISAVDTHLADFASTALRALLPGSSPPWPATLGRSFHILRNGKPLSASTAPSATLSEIGFKSYDHVSFVPRLVGGGGDGGSTCAESRSCYLEMYAQKKAAKVDPKDKSFARWTNCLLSAHPLTPPCVVDKLGNIMNKEAVLRTLQSKSMPGGLRHIRGLKDVMDVKLAEIPSVGEDALVRFHCPMSGLEFNGNFRFFAMKCCGSVISQRALKELKAQTSCPMCRSDTGERIPVNGTAEEVEELRKAMDEERAKAKAEKKKASVSAASGVPVPSSAAEVDPAAPLHADGTSGGSADETKAGGKEGEGVATAVTKVGGLVKARGAASAVAGNATPATSEHQSSKKHQTQALNGSEAKRYKATEHAPAGATKSVYASIFTSSRKEDFKETYSCRSLPLGRN